MNWFHTFKLIKKKTQVSREWPDINYQLERWFKYYYHLFFFLKKKHQNSKEEFKNKV
jgi:hypothetical protein